MKVYSISLDKFIHIYKNIMAHQYYYTYNSLIQETQHLEYYGAYRNDCL